MSQLHPPHHVSLSIPQIEEGTETHVPFQAELRDCLEDFIKEPSDYQKAQLDMYLKVYAEFHSVPPTCATIDHNTLDF